jgi:hypothetical protein
LVADAKLVCVSGITLDRSSDVIAPKFASVPDETQPQEGYVLAITKPLRRLLNRPLRDQPGQARIHHDPFFADPAAVEDDYWRMSRRLHVDR